jgi:flavin-dependent dehydrogenase
MRIGIIGAGPAGTVCALSLLRGAQRSGRAHEVLLFDGKSFLQCGPIGCNMCAGVISESLLDRLAELGAKAPPTLIQRRLTGHYFQTRAGGIHLAGHPESPLCTVFRGMGPQDALPDIDHSFDQFLLQSAMAAGAVHHTANVAEVVLPARPEAAFRLHTHGGRGRTHGDEVHEVDVVVGAFGVNSALARRFERLGFGYRRPATFHVCQADLPLDAAFLDRTYGGEIKILSLGLPSIRFGALTPKREHVTVTIIGQHLRRGDLERFLLHPQVRRHFPKNWHLPRSYCHCHPLLPVTAARNPVTDRLLVIGDAHVSRYLKGGIESAFFTGSLAARMISAGRLTREELVQGYVGPCRARYVRDNCYGRLLFRCNDVISRVPLVTAAGLQLLEREQRLPDWRDRPHARILWRIFTGEAPYRTIAREALSATSALTAASALCRTVAGLVRPGDER